MAYWLLKSEPSEFSYDDLERKGRTVWDGISNALALRHLRAMSSGDSALLYHTGRERAVVGTIRVVSDPYPDPGLRDPLRVVVDIMPERRFPLPVPLAVLKKEREFRDSPLLRLPRLSLLPVTPGQWKLVNALSQ
jgi:predicted RNA-binding protein with PUA-like domain